jgi:hypothetical protein
MSVTRRTPTRRTRRPKGADTGKVVKLEHKDLVRVQKLVSSLGVPSEVEEIRIKLGDELTVSWSTT